MNNSEIRNLNQLHTTALQITCFLFENIHRVPADYSKDCPSYTEAAVRANKALKEKP